MSEYVGIRALAVKYPSVLRTNDFWRKHYPELIADVERKGAGKVWSGPENPEGPSAVFDTAMGPYLSDPFRGTVERRVFGPGEDTLGLELDAAKQVLAAAQLNVDDIDYAISTSVVPKHPSIGNGIYVAGELGLKCPAVFVESACSGSMVSFQQASALIKAGMYHTVLVTVSCSYSQTCEPSGALSITSGDGAAAFIVGPVAEGSGVLAQKTVNTAVTNDALFLELALDEKKAPRIRVGASRSGGKVLREHALPCLKRCVHGALEQAKVKLEEIDFFVFNTPTAWYADFCATGLGIDRQKTIDTYPLYANTGPALTTGNLYHALAEGRIKPGDLVVVYSIGSVSSASAAVFRWDQTALGPMPEPATSVQ